MSFLSLQGTLALASRLKVLSERSYDLVDQIYREHGLGLQARWFPVLRLLEQRGPLSVGEIAREIGLSHSAISQMAGRLTREGWLCREPGGGDKRLHRLALSERCRAELKAARPLWQAMRASVERRVMDTGVDLLGALSLYEASLDAQPLPAEVAQRFRQRQADAVRIVAYAPALREHFYRLNAEWLTRYYRIEPIDHAVLSDPETHILAPGGCIVFAQLGEDIVGTCALLQESPGVFELTKMAVTDSHQGLGIGRKLIEAILAEYRARGGQTLFLESQRKLQPALKLYESVGFEMQPGAKPGTHYQRADVYMIYREPPA